MTRPRCGPGGYIQVGMRGCCESWGGGHLGTHPRLSAHSFFGKEAFAIQAPSFGGEHCLQRDLLVLVLGFPSLLLLLGAAAALLACSLALGIAVGGIS